MVPGLVTASILALLRGLIVFWTDYTPEWLFQGKALLPDLRSTFINRNHFATYIGLVLLCALGLFYHRVALAGRTAAPRTGGRVPKGARVTTTADRLEQFALLTWKPLLVVLVLTTALVLTHSRGGFGSTFAGAVVLLACLNYRRRIRSHRSLAVIVAAAGMAATSSAGFSASIARTLAGTWRKILRRLSIQRMLQSSPDSALTTAVPTCPAPNSTMSKPSGRTAIR